MGVFARMLLQILQDVAAGKLERRNEAERDRAEHAEGERGQEERGVGTGFEHHVDGHVLAKRADEQVGRPKRNNEARGSAHEGEQ